MRAIERRIVPHLLAQHADRALARPQLAGRQLQQRRLAGAVRPKQPGHAGADFDRELVDADDVAVPLRNVVEGDDRRHLSRSSDLMREVENAYRKHQPSRPARPPTNTRDTAVHDICSKYWLALTGRRQLAEPLPGRVGAEQMLADPPQIRRVRNERPPIAFGGRLISLAHESLRSPACRAMRPRASLLLDIRPSSSTPDTVLVTNQMPIQNSATYRELRESDESASISSPAEIADHQPIGDAGQQDAKRVAQDRDVEAEQQPQHVRHDRRHNNHRRPTARRSRPACPANNRSAAAAARNTAAARCSAGPG